MKTSLAPGSKVVTEYLNAAGLQSYLDNLGFNLVGYGCTTCIGNSGPLPQPVSDEIGSQDLVVASVLSGNRNFEGRISPEIRARLSPLGCEHINFHGFYPFHRPDLGEGLRDLRDPAADQEED